MPGMFVEQPVEHSKKGGNGGVNGTRCKSHKK